MTNCDFVLKIWQIIFLIPLAMLFTWIWFPIFGYNNAMYTFYCSLGVAAAALFLAFGNYLLTYAREDSMILGFQLETFKGRRSLPGRGYVDSRIKSLAIRTLTELDP